MISPRIGHLVLSSVLVIVACDKDEGPDIPGPPTAMTILAGDGQTGVVGTELATPLLIRVTDASGNALPGQVVNFRVLTGGGSVFAGSAGTNSDGRAQDRWTLGTRARDTQRVEVRAVDANTGAALVFGSFWAVGVAGPATKLQKASTDSAQLTVTRPVTSLPRVRVLDQYDNAVIGAAVTFTATAGSGTVIGGSQVTDTSGYATVGGWTLGNEPAVNTVTAAVTGTSLSIAFTTHALPPAQYVLSATSENVEAGAIVTLSAQLADVAGAAVALSGRTVTWTATGGSLSSTTSTTNSAGVATVTFTADTVLDATSTTITATEASRTGSKQISLLAGAATRISFVTQPANGGYLVALSPIRVAVQDRYGNTRTSDTRQVTIALGANPGGATLGGMAVVAAVAGVATFGDITLNRDGSGYTLVASNSALSSTTSSTFAVSPVGIVARDVLPISTLLLKDGVLYYSTSGFGARVARVSAIGTDARDVFSYSSAVSSPHSGRALISDGNHIYAAVVSGSSSIKGFSILRANLDGSGAQVIHSRLGDDWIVGYDLAAEAQHIYYSGTEYVPGSPTGQDPRILRVSMPAGDTLRVLPKARKPFTLANGEIFFFDPTAIKAIPGTGGTERIISPYSSSGAGDLIVSNDTLYWGIGNAIQSVTADSGAVITRATGFTDIDYLIKDGSTIYVIDAGTLRRLDLNTSAITTMTTDELYLNPTGTQVVVDAESVYWISGREQAIKKTRKDP